jgi:S1-C subfamily serine protease
MLVFHCEHCGHKLGAKESHLGRTFACVNCRQPVVVRDEVAVEHVVSEPAAADRFDPEYSRYVPPTSDQPAEPAENEYAAPGYPFEAPPEQAYAAGAGDAAPAEAPDAAATVSQYARKPSKHASRKWIYWQIGGCAAVAAAAAFFILRSRFGPDPAKDAADAAPAVAPSAVDDSGNSTEDDASRTVKAGSPSVVAAHPPPTNVHLSPEELFARSSPSVGRVEQLDAHGEPVAFGTGFFVSSDGLLVTNYHVLDGASGARFVMDESRQFEIEGYVAADREHDLVLLKVRATDVPALKVWAGDPPRVGASVYAIGNPEGLSNTLSNGLISALRQGPSGEVRMVQISVPISHGSSGGPLMTDAGLVVGVTSAGLAEGQNLNFAIPSSAVDRLVRAAGAVRRIADLGIANTRDQAARAIYVAMEMTDVGHADEAVALLEKVARDQRETWLFWYAMGLAHESLRNGDLAASDFANVERLQPELAAPWEVIGAAYLNGGKPERAVGCFTKAIDRDPRAILAYSGLARADMKLGKTSEAVDTCLKGLARTGENAALLVVLGDCYVAQNQTGLSVKAFERAVQSDPRDGRALLELGYAYMAAARLADARQAFGKVLAPDSDAGEVEKQAARRGIAQLDH